jgi:hypothetical protein
MTACNLVQVLQHFKGTYCLHLQSLPDYKVTTSQNTVNFVYNVFERAIHCVGNLMEDAMCLISLI